MDHELVDYMRREVLDLLDAGRVGLYEFIGIGRGHAPELSDAVLRVHARAALSQLLVSADARLAWQVWGQPDRVAPADDAVPGDEDWSDPTDAPYLAVVPAPVAYGSEFDG